MPGLASTLEHSTCWGRANIVSSSSGVTALLQQLNFNPFQIQMKSKIKIVVTSPEEVHQACCILLWKILTIWIPKALSKCKRFGLGKGVLSGPLDWLENVTFISGENSRVVAGRISWISRNPSGKRNTYAEPQRKETRDQKFSNRISCSCSPSLHQTCLWRGEILRSVKHDLNLGRNILMPIKNFSGCAGHGKDVV